jgi:hypothetical protein
MADGGGFGSKLGIIKLASWAAGYSAPTALIPFLNETLSVAFDRIPDESLVGTASRGPSAQGGLAVAGETTHNLDYNNFDTLFECLMGTAVGRTFTISDDDLPKWPSVEVDKVIQRHRFYAGKIVKATISCRAGGIAQVKFGWLIRKRDLSATAFPAISTPGPRNLVLFKHAITKIWIGDQADALTSGDAIGFSSYEIAFDRQMVADDRDSNSPTEILEPIPGDWRACEIKLTIPRYNTATSVLADWKDNDTALQLQIQHTGGSESFSAQLPNLRITDGFDVPVEGPGPITLEGTLQASPSQAGNPLYVGNEMRVTFI